MTTKQKDEDTDEHRVRLDKWLWAARFFKTRNLAIHAINGGKVHYNLYSGGHAFPSWREELAPALRWLVGSAGSSRC